MPNESNKPNNRSQADKDKSRQQSRQVSGKEAAKGSTGGKGPQKGAPQKPGAQKPGGQRAGAAAKSGGGGQRPPRAGRAPTPAPVPRRSMAGLFTWGIVGVVIVIVAVLVIVHVATGGTGPTSGSIKTFEPISAQLEQQVTSVPESVYNTVGVTSPAATVSPPITTSGQKLLKFATPSGGQLPGFYYYGAEYCPYSAAERWGIALALARFGTLSNLGYMESSSSDVYSNTHTLTFEKATYTSKYISARLDEYLSNQVGSNGQYEVLQPPNSQELPLVTKYDSSTYFGGAVSDYPAFPFIDMGNKVLQLSSSYTPSLLGGDNWEGIGSGLSDPTNLTTQALVATANYLSAGICNSDGQKPADVCTGKGVKAADAKLKLAS